MQSARNDTGIQTDPAKEIDNFISILSKVVRNYIMNLYVQLLSHHIIYTMHALKSTSYQYIN